ncbi:MAG TPA: beta-ketoacyl-[acyl-carrier-protein] synthase family protein [Thermohalobaculum sp.]|nr:beta-ketoacyl-[acyl-carrier-protein] synthase family protein [Thermohalobaculum sp.]
MSSGGRRVVVTGLGVVSALGADRETHLEGLREGRSGIGPIVLIPTERLSVRIAAEARDFSPEGRFGRQELALYDRVTQIGLAAAAEAVDQSGIGFEGEAALRAATIIGCAMGGLHTLDDGFDTLYAQQKNRLHPFTIPRVMANATASHISMRHGLKGPAWTVSTACSSANHAIGQAFHLIRSGVSDRALTGGTESMLSFGGMKSWEGLRVMSRTACRPFSRNRDGMVVGEGAAILVLEELEGAKARGAPILGEIVGHGASADAGDIVAPSVDGASRAMAMALDDAGLAPDAIGYINAHGTATAANDRTEAAAILAVFGEHGRRIPVSSTKSMHGHPLGAAGALEAAAVLMALGEGVVPPTINHEEADPDIPLDVVPNQAREVRVEAALSNSVAFGGLNAVVAFRRFDG